MSVEEYYERVRALGLRQVSSQSRTAWRHIKSDEIVNVQDPAHLVGTEQMLEALEILKEKVASLA